MKSKPLVVTAGEPAGIGPELLIKLASRAWSYPFVVAGDADLLRERAAQINRDVEIHEWSGEALVPKPGKLYVKSVPLNCKSIAGQLDANNADYVLRMLDEAILGCMHGTYAAMVTGPVHKGVINEAGVAFSGHTEYLQEHCGVDQVVMMLANRHMKVALATTHIPLKSVANAITCNSLTRVLDILIADLQNKFGIARPKILVAGLNPHAGESGHMGREEIEVIEPVMASFVDHDVELIGPLPADTLFTPKYLQDADAVLAMYHDQGLPVLKYAGFGESVNITLGLPIIRTSVDHGTALDLAGTGNADEGSFLQAIEQALLMLNATAAAN